MRLDAFSKVHTVEDMKNHLELLYSVSQEHNIEYLDMLKVQGTEFQDLTYILSSAKGNYISTHFFMDTDELTGLHGLLEYSMTKRVLKKLCDSIYNKLVSVHPLVWLGLRSDLTYDVISNGVVILSGVQSYDLLRLGESFLFLQLDYGDKTSLICLDTFDVTQGIYIVQSREDFDNWFKSKVVKRGYEGELDMVLISELFGTYFEVINTIFSIGNFAPIRGS